MAVPGRGSKRFDQDADDKKFIAGAIKRPGRLTELVGGKPSQNMKKVDKLAQNGTPQQKQEANFYKNVLRKKGSK